MTEPERVETRQDPGAPRRDTAFGTGVPLGRWFGVEVRAHWSVLVTVLLFVLLIATVELPARSPESSTLTVWVAAAVLAPLLFLTLLAHELAHAVVARHYGLGVHRISLWMLGGLTELEGEPPNPRAEAFIAGAGPLTSAVAGGLCVGGAFLTPGSIVPAALAWLGAVNLLLAVFNLLPGAPLDGGRLLRAALWWRGHDRARAASSAAQVGRVLGMVLVALGVVQLLAGGALGLWTALVGWFILNGAATERFAVRAEGLGHLTVRDAMSPTPWIFPEWSTVSQFSARARPDAAHQLVFPLTDLDGRFSGVVTLAALADVPHERADTVRLRDLAVTHQVLTTTPDLELRSLLLPLHLRGGLAVVLDDGHPVGVITDADLARTAELVRTGVVGTPPQPGG